MDKAYDPQATELNIYKLWEEGGYFAPKKVPKEDLPAGRQAFTILLPPPNANADLHVGHAMYVVEDIMIRYHRMKGDPTLWLPGADHAGFETQYVYEKQLAKEGKSRFDFDRETLYQNIWDFVHTNRGTMENQLRRLGFSLDWSRNIFTLDPKVVETVYKTFKRLFDDGLVYRGIRLVNYCTKDGTGFSDLEVKYVERNDPLYYMKYGPFTIATARPETKFRDTALAVNPKDKRYKTYIGKTLEIMGLLGPITMTVIPDPDVDPRFGTGIMKVTPAHDPHDFELGQKHNLPVTPIIDFRGRMDFSWFLNPIPGINGAPIPGIIDPKYKARAENYHGKKIAVARALMVEDLKVDGLLIKTDETYTHRIGTCYKCGTVIEPLPMSQWFVKVKPLADAAKKAIKTKKITFVPKRFEKAATDWLSNFHDWNISRQIVWGIRIPAWECTDCHEWTITDGETPIACATCGKNNLTQDTDVFDTWFSSGQWPYATLQATSDKNDLSYFYPTSVMETGYDILPWWVCRMAMLGIYAMGDVPFRTVYLHGLVRDGKGQKMSKSKGNVINPLKMVDQYGADALRMALVFGTAAGNDQALSEDKIRGMRNFANKIWNAARFVSLLTQTKETGQQDQQWSNEIEQVAKKVTIYIEKYNFNAAAELLYESFWHRYCDFAIEQAKTGTISQVVMQNSLETYLKLLHPFMPFVTEEIWGTLQNKSGSDPLIISPWPEVLQ